MSIESVMLSNHLILCHPLLLLPSIVPSISLFKWVKWVSSSHQVAKVLEFQLQHQSFQQIFRTNFIWDGLVWSPCCPRDSPESSPALFDKECTFSCWLYCARSHQSCPTLCNPMDCSLPVSSVHEFSRQENWSGLACPSPFLWDVLQLCLTLCDPTDASQTSQSFAVSWSLLNLMSVH